VWMSNECLRARWLILLSGPLHLVVRAVGASMLSVSARLHVLSLSPTISLCACVQADRFHQTCDAIVNTVVLIRVKQNNFIFGGFTGDAAWSSNFGHVRSSNSFVFSLVNAVGGPVRLPCRLPEYAIWCHSSCGPVFGHGNDICISGNWTRAQYGGGCRCSPGSYATCDPAFTVTPVTCSLLAGSHDNWSMGELEVFALEASG
jgi:hypothetical protein